MLNVQTPTIQIPTIQDAIPKFVKISNYFDYFD